MIGNTLRFQSNVILFRRVARIWKRGGAILKEWEKCKRPWTEFSLFLNRKFKGFFRPKSGALKKKKRSSPKLRLVFRPKSEIQTFFPPKIRCSPKKKKGLHRNWDWFFGQIRKFKRLWGGVFLWRGYFQFFTKNRPQKHQKRAILHTSQANGGLERPLATLLILFE